MVRRRLWDLACWVFEEFRISLDETTVSREVRKLGFRRLTARPQFYAQSEPAVETAGLRAGVLIKADLYDPCICRDSHSARKTQSHPICLRIPRIAL